jgi:hypothetical protein
MRVDGTLVGFIAQLSSLVPNLDTYIWAVADVFYSLKQVKRLFQEAEIDLFESDFSESVIESATTFLNGALQKGQDRPI